MSGIGDEGDERETLVSETSLASDDTMQADSQSSGSVPSTGSVIRQGRASQPRSKLGRYTKGDCDDASASGECSRGG